MYKYPIKQIIFLIIFLQSISNSFATNPKLPIPSDARPALRQLKTHEIPKWAYETPQYWDSTDVHPLRDLSMILGGACDNLEKKAKDGVTLNMVKLHDAVCALKDAFPTPYKDQLKVLDVGFYTLAQAPYINQPDIRNYLWDKQMEIINRDFPTFPYRLLMAKQFKPNGKYADFRVGLKLPRATSGMFEKMNDAVEEAMQAIILKTIEDEYKRTNDLMAAETKGVEKLKELLGKIEELGTMSEELLALNGFEGFELDISTKIRRNGVKSLSSPLNDYAGIQYFDTDSNQWYDLKPMFATGLGQLNGEYSNLTMACIFTDNVNYGSAEYQTAKTEFDNSTASVTYWLHWFIPSDPTKPVKLFFKENTKIPPAKAEEILNEKWYEWRIGSHNQNDLTTGNKGMRGGAEDCSGYKWRMKCSSFYTALDPNTTDISYGVVLGIIDSFLDIIGHVAETTTSAFDRLKAAGIYYVKLKIEGIKYGFSLFKSILNVGLWKTAQKVVSDIKLSFKELGKLMKDKFNEIRQQLEQIGNLLADTSALIISIKSSIATIFNDFLSDINGTNGKLKQGYTIGKIVGDIVIGWATGAAVAKVAQYASKVANIAKIQSQFLDALTSNKLGESIKDAWNTTEDWLSKFKCKIGIGGCFIAGTPVLAAAGAMPIEQLQLGDKVWANTYVNSGYIAQKDKDDNTTYRINADAMRTLTSDNNEKCDATAGNLNKWFAISLKLPTFEGESTKVRLLRPQWWLDENHISNANDVTFIELPEMGVAGIATVTDLTAYSNSDLLDTNSFPSGEGRDGAFSQGAITGTFEHEVTAMQRLALSSGDTLSVTAAHPFYSLTYGTWRYAGELEESEDLLTQSGNVSVCDNTIASGTYKVYNVEVRQWHNYLVGKDAVVVHNSCVEDGDGNESCLKAFQEMATNFSNKIDDIFDNALKNNKISKVTLTKLKNNICKIKKWSELNISQVKRDQIEDYLEKIGKKLPSQIEYDEFGFPDYNDISFADIVIDMVGNNTIDYQKGLDGLFVKYNVNNLTELKVATGLDIEVKADKNLIINGVVHTWHHHQDGSTMQIVPFEIHDKTKHLGGDKLVSELEMKGFFPSPSIVKKHFKNCPK